MAMSPPMRAGKLRHRVEIHRPTETRDVIGGVTRTFAKINTRWAAVMPTAGRELTHAGVIRADVTHEVRMRHFDDLDRTDRLVHDGRTLQIESILNPDERRVEMVCLCKEIV